MDSLDDVQERQCPNNIFSMTGQESTDTNHDQCVLRGGKVSLVTYTGDNTFASYMIFVKSTGPILKVFCFF
jgi:hypothetical protein